MIIDLLFVRPSNIKGIYDWRCGTSACFTYVVDWVANYGAVAFTGNALGGVVDVVEAGGLVTVTASGAISGINKELYIDASDPQKVTATLSSTAGTYYRIGFSKSITSADGE